MLERLSSLKVIGGVNYVLMALAPLAMLPPAVAVVVAYAKRGAARGTWMESHLDWQIATFWATLAWAVGAVSGGLVLTLLLDGSPTGVLLMGLVLIGVFVRLLRRLSRGAVALLDERPVD